MREEDEARISEEMKKMKVKGVMITVVASSTQKINFIFIWLANSLPVLIFSDITEFSNYFVVDDVNDDLTLIDTRNSLLLR